ncbi:Ras-specific guanine nucleotide-releasing factor RalGPS1 [Halotydeus destructor]|nr:Ras-specific guanine nucleotide-releasing factor RalGPS1 [Halotydeus destructor]
MFRETSSFYTVKTHSPQSASSSTSPAPSSRAINGVKSLGAHRSPVQISPAEQSSQSTKPTKASALVPNRAKSKPAASESSVSQVRPLSVSVPKQNGDFHKELVRALEKRTVGGHKRCASEGGKVLVPRTLSIPEHFEPLDGSSTTGSSSSLSVATSSNMPSLSSSCSQGRLDMLTKTVPHSASVNSFSIKHRLGPFYEVQSLASLASADSAAHCATDGHKGATSWYSLSEKFGSLGLAATWSNGFTGRQAKPPPSSKSVDLLKIPAKDLAAQLTRLDFPVFKAIRESELISLSWNTHDKKILSPNIYAFTRRFNQVSFWVVEEVLLYASRKMAASSSRSLSKMASTDGDTKLRAHVISHFIKTAKRLLDDHNNLHSCYAIVSALNSLPIYRLSKTWLIVGKKDKAIFERLSKLFSDDRNFEELRRHLERLATPCIPYLGMYLRDLIYVDIVNPVTPGSDTRAKKMAAIIDFIKQFQSSSYDYIDINDAILEYLSAERYIEELQKFLEDQNYRLSLELEPAPSSLRPLPPSEQKSPKAKEKSTFYVECWQTKL